MWSFLRHLFQNMGTEQTVVVLDAEEVGRTQRYRFRPSRVIGAWGGSVLAVGLLAVALIVFTPLRTYIPGYGTEQIEQSARLNTMRLQSLQDSLAAQRRYIVQLRRLITGRVDSIAPSRSGISPGQGPLRQGGGQTASGEEPDGNESGAGAHEQPALAPSPFSASQQASSRGDGGSNGLSFPIPSPVQDGFPTRDFNAEAGHYGIDVAVSEGTSIRAVGAGYVVWSDWMQDGGYTIAVQHADGYLSVYKHNGRLLKRLGDRVSAQEPIAMSGNTGAITTGPHLHFELWRNGLAQEPRTFIAGW